MKYTCACSFVCASPFAVNTTVRTIGGYHRCGVRGSPQSLAEILFCSAWALMLRSQPRILVPLEILRWAPAFLWLQLELMRPGVEWSMVNHAVCGCVSGPSTTQKKKTCQAGPRRLANGHNRPGIGVVTRRRRRTECKVCQLYSHHYI